MNFIPKKQFDFPVPPGNDIWDDWIPWFTKKESGQAIRLMKNIVSRITEEQVLLLFFPYYYTTVSIQVEMPVTGLFAA